MPSPRPVPWLLACLCATLYGCAGSGPLLSSKGAGVGTLKTSLSHMEYENQQLKREVASLKADVRQAEDRLVQEESANGELSSRLDNALAVLKRKGVGGGELAESGVSARDPEPARTTLPAGRSNRKPRKPPFAQIPGRLDALPTDPGDETSNGWGTPSGSRGLDGPNAQGGSGSPVVWLPVARGATTSSGSRR